MSRSRKKLSIITDYSRTGTKFAKRLANKKVRKYKLWIPNGNWYRKIEDPWNICDWKWIIDPDSEYYNRYLRK